MDAFLNGGADYVGTALNVAFYGLHVGIYGAFLAIHQHRGTHAFRGVAQLASTLSFMLSTAFVALSVACVYFELTNQEDSHASAVNAMTNAGTCFYTLIDLLTQGLLIYRCWIIWNRSYAVVVLPAFLAIGGFACILAVTIIPSVESHALIQLSLLLGLAKTGFSVSIAVNAIVTFTIVSRIWILSQKFAKTNGQGIEKRYTVIVAMLLESGIAVLLGQILWLVLYQTGSAGYSVITGPVTQIYGFTPTVILIRVALGSSYESDTRLTNSIAFNNRTVDSSSEVSNPRISIMNESVAGERRTNKKDMEVFRYDGNEEKDNAGSASYSGGSA